MRHKWVCIGSLHILILYIYIYITLRVVPCSATLSIHKSSGRCTVKQYLDFQVWITILWDKNKQQSLKKNPNCIFLNSKFHTPYSIPILCMVLILQGTSVKTCAYVIDKIFAIFFFLATYFGVSIPKYFTLNFSQTKLFLPVCIKNAVSNLVV